MLWIFLAIGAQLINAVVALIDKYIVSDDKVLPRPFVYAFYTCLLAGGWIVIYIFSLIPLDAVQNLPLPSFGNIEKPTLEVIALSILAAYSLFLALVSMFTGLRAADASDVVPVVGAVSALATFGLGYFFLDLQLSHNFIYGIVLLAGGTFLVSRFRFTPRVAMNAIHAGLFFALHYVAIKGLFSVTAFDNGFFWSRIALVFFALTLLLVPSYYGKISEQTKKSNTLAGIIVVGSKILAGVSSILILKATDLGDVAVVQALGGLQFIFILLIGILIGHKTPLSCGEGGCRRGEVVQKAAFIAIISFGLLVLFI